MSRDAAGAGTGNKRSLAPFLLPEGSKGVYYTWSTNIENPNRTDTCPGNTSRGMYTCPVSSTPIVNSTINAGPAGSEADIFDQSMFPHAIPNGQFVVFASPATNLGGGSFSNPSAAPPFGRVRSTSST